MGVPPTEKSPLPPGRNPPLVVLMVAVNVTGLPWAGLLLLETTAIVVEAWITVIGTAAEVLALRPAVPVVVRDNRMLTRGDRKHSLRR